MKKLLLMAILALGLTGCQAWDQLAKDWQSNTSGLNRTITLYSADGSVIQSWNATTTLRSDGGAADWIGSDGKRIMISGTYIIEEK